MLQLPPEKVTMEYRAPSGAHPDPQEQVNPGSQSMQSLCCARALGNECAALILFRETTDLQLNDKNL